MGDSVSKYHELISEEEFDQLVEKILLDASINK